MRAAVPFQGNRDVIGENVRGPRGPYVLDRASSKEGA